MVWQPLSPSFTPEPGCDCLQPYVYSPDPRYTVAAEWVLCRDLVHRPRYKALFRGRTIGEIMPSFRRANVLNSLLQLIEWGGIGAMSDLPNEEAAADD